MEESIEDKRDKDDGGAKIRPNTSILLTTCETGTPWLLETEMNRRCVSQEARGNMEESTELRKHVHTKEAPRRQRGKIQNSHSRDDGIRPE